MKELNKDIIIKFIITIGIFLALGLLLTVWQNANAKEEDILPIDIYVPPIEKIKILKVSNPQYDATFDTTKKLEKQTIEYKKENKTEYLENATRFFRIITPSENYKTYTYDFIDHNCIQTGEGTIICGSYIIKSLYEKN